MFRFLDNAPIWHQFAISTSHSFLSLLRKLFKIKLFVLVTPQLIFIPYVSFLFLRAALHCNYGWVFFMHTNKHIKVVVPDAFFSKLVNIETTPDFSCLEHRKTQFHKSCVPFEWGCFSHISLFFTVHCFFFLS